MKRRILSIFCVLALCLTLLPTTVFAVDTPLTTLTILGQSIIDEDNPTNSTYWKVNDDGTSIEAGSNNDYTIEYDGNGTLTLNGIDITATSPTDTNTFYGIYADGDLTIVLEGNNTFNMTQNTPPLMR